MAARLGVAFEFWGGPAAAHRARLDDERRRLRDRHEEARHLRARDGHRPAALDLLAEDRDDRPRRPEHVAEANRDEPRLDLGAQRGGERIDVTLARVDDEDEWLERVARSPASTHDALVETLSLVAATDREHSEDRSPSTGRVDTSLALPSVGTVDSRLPCRWVPTPSQGRVRSTKEALWLAGPRDRSS